MTRADSDLRRTFKTRLRPHGYELFPIETGGTVAGVCDTFWMHPESASTGWIEMKATTGWAVEVRPHQAGFLARLSQSGGRGFVAVLATGAGSGGPLRSRLWLLHGRAAGLLGAEGLRAVVPADVLGVWDGPPASWDWRAVSAVLLG